MKICSLFLFLICLSFARKVEAQERMETSLTTAIISHEFSDLQFVKSSKRKFLNLSNSGFIRKVNPLTYVGASLLFFYQRVISEQISADCTYQTSCSETTKRAIEKYGLIKGALLGVHQLSTCVPGNVHEHPSHIINEQGKIINDL